MASLPFEFIDFAALPGVECPCGVARRGLMDQLQVPYSLHITDISKDARVHYHRQTTETYLFLACDQDAQMELDGRLLPVRPQTALVIYPGTRHRAVGTMRVAIIASPKFDESDEYFD
ncbi:MAG: cupin domain-containing protein [Pirellulaceae bacterium]|nr:cupin domain-containing protein [Pirellulaceae bacterium]